MSDSIIYLVGLFHVAFYAGAGTIVAATLATVQACRFAKVMGRIIQWLWARERWRERGSPAGQEPRP